MSSIRCAKCDKILSLGELDRGHCGSAKCREKESTASEKPPKVGPKVKIPIVLLVCPSCLEESLAYDEVLRLFLCLNKGCRKSYALAEYGSWKEEE